MDLLLHEYLTIKINNIMINYQISAKESTQVQGINVALSAEFNKNELPATVNANCGGSLVDGIYMNASAVYDIETGNFLSFNGNQIPDGFIEELKSKIIGFYNQIKEGGEE